MESLVSNLDLFVILKDANRNNQSDHLFQAVVSRLGYTLSEEDSVTLTEFCRRFTRAAMKRWQHAHRKFEEFKKLYETWLEADIDWPSCINLNAFAAPMKETEEPVPGPSSSSVGTSTKRKLVSRKPFEDLKSKQKKKRISDQEESCSSELMYLATEQLKKEGQGNIASVIEYLMKHPEAADQLKNVVEKKTTILFTPEKALGLLLSLKLTKWQYITLRETAIREGVKNLYPSYFKVQQAKLECYPPKDTICVTDTFAKIQLQSLLDKTAQRILQSLSIDIQDKQLCMISKWGFDGASNQSRYKQKMDSEEDDSSIFMTSLVPLKVSCGEEIIWTNPKPCSASYCRPIQFSFMKETKFVVTEQQKKMEEEIKELQASPCGTNQVTHELMMTMIDGKVCTYLSEARSSATCYLCLAKPSEMNNLEGISQKNVSSNMYKFGLSSLHARIKCMECLLHIAYRLDLKKWAVRDDDKIILEKRKKIIQEKFKTELNLLIDIVKQGSGTTNDGNTARKFFECPTKTAAITGLNQNLIHKFAVILQAVTSGEIIKIDKFKDYAYDTAKMYVDMYPWYYMPSTVHKLLLHGADIISHNAIVPIGSLSEEASEARNKDFRRYREFHSRKMNRKSCNEDIFNMLLLSSDPRISATRPKMRSMKKQPLFSDTKLLIVQEEESDFEYCDVSALDPDSELDSDSESCDV